MILRGHNGWYSSGLPDDCINAVKSTKSSNDNPRIHVIAFSTQNKGRWFISMGGGAWNARGPQNFLDKLNEINVRDVKDVSFGPNDTWAIVMKNGHCHGHMQSGPLKVVNDHQGSISYVSLTENESEWIVGWESNGWKSHGLPTSISDFIRDLNSKQKTIHSVHLGSSASSTVIHHEDGYKWWGMSTDFSNKYKESDTRECWVW